jgi:hypothetical protein
MTKAGTNLLIDALLALAMLAYVWTCLVVKLIFPPGTEAAGWTLWGLNYDAWCNVQFVMMAVMLLCVLVHLMLHWKWVCNFVAGRLGRWRGIQIETNEAVNTIYGVVTLIAVFLVLGTLLTIAEFTVRAAPK